MRLRKLYALRRAQQNTLEYVATLRKKNCSGVGTEVALHYPSIYNWMRTEQHPMNVNMNALRNHFNQFGLFIHQKALSEWILHTLTYTYSYTPSHIHSYTHIHLCTHTFIYKHTHTNTHPSISSLHIYRIPVRVVGFGTFTINVQPLCSCGCESSGPVSVFIDIRVVHAYAHDSNFHCMRF